MKAVNKKQLQIFKDTVWSYYTKNKRPMPWRDNTSSYYVVVSEIMLQQTQVSRVMQKFPDFIKRFPDWLSLARAEMKDVLQEWSGLGYNRRALFLKRIAEEITKQGTTKGVLPKTLEKLQKLSGIGPNTAGSILAFAYNIPHPFIETNIRSVFIHFFFTDIERAFGKQACKKIHDNELMPLIEKTIDTQNPREWYYALMDYGSYLKKQLTNPSRQSAHHVKQTPFKGSNRELRAGILKKIIEKPMNETMIIKLFPSHHPDDIRKNIKALIAEGFITKKGINYLV